MNHSLIIGVGWHSKKRHWLDRQGEEPSQSKETVSERGSIGITHEGTQKEADKQSKL